MMRKEIIPHIVRAGGEDPILSTAGKASLELLETRVANRQSHEYEYLTASGFYGAFTIDCAFGVAIDRPN